MINHEALSWPRYVFVIRMSSSPMVLYHITSLPQPLPSHLPTAHKHNMRQQPSDTTNKPSPYTHLTNTSQKNTTTNAITGHCQTGHCNGDLNILLMYEFCYDVLRITLTYTYNYHFCDLDLLYEGVWQ